MAAQFFFKSTNRGDSWWMNPTDLTKNVNRWAPEMAIMGVAGDKPMAEKPAWNINAGYVQRAAHVLPKSGTHRPWNVRHNYVLDAIDHRLDRIEESMVFGRAEAREAEPA